MNVEELKHTSLFKALKEDEKFQNTITKLGVTPEWGQLRLFVGKLKQTMLEDMLSCERIEDIQRYKNQILGMERLVELPQAVNLVKEAEKQDAVTKDQTEREAQRRKYNPGAILDKAVSKVKDYYG